MTSILLVTDLISDFEVCIDNTPVDLCLSIVQTHHIAILSWQQLKNRSHIKESNRNRNCEAN